MARTAKIDILDRSLIPDCLAVLPEIRASPIKTTDRGGTNDPKARTLVTRPDRA